MSEGQQTSDVVEAAGIEPLPARRICLVITLRTASSVRLFRIPESEGLEAFSLFSTCGEVQGRAKYRLHLGFFSSYRDANETLSIVRREFPDAYICPSPKIPETTRSRNFIERPEGPDASVTAKARTLPTEPLRNVSVSNAVFDDLLNSLQIPEPLPEVADQCHSKILVAPAPQEAFDSFDLELFPMEQIEAVPVLDAKRTLYSIQDCASLELVEDSPANLGSSPRPIRRVDEESGLSARSINPADTLVLSDSQVLTILESPVAPLPHENQRYAIQICWSERPIDATSAMWNDIFNEYKRYSIRANHGGQCGWSLRLGFFTKKEAAETVCGFLRHEYSAAIVVLVTEKEQVVALQSEALESRAMTPERAAQIERQRVVQKLAGISTPTLATKDQINPRFKTLVAEPQRSLWGELLKPKVALKQSPSKSRAKTNPLRERVRNRMMN